MLISDATAISYGNTPIYKVYLGEDIVWGVEYLNSENITTAGGFSVGTSVDKTFSTSNKKTLAAHLPGNADFEAPRTYWPDWGDDIFDTWGFFYIYDVVANNYRAVVLTGMDSADGVQNTQTFSLNGITYTVKFGYPVQGIFKFDVVSSNRTRDFVFGFDGNLGSNGSTINSNLSQNYTLDGENFTLHYNYNYQGTVPSEKFYTYVVPYERSKNKTTRSFTRYLYNVDNLAIHSVSVKRGVTIYIAKQNDVRDWIINDLQISSD
jgi:hypothetical protein